MSDSTEGNMDEPLREVLYDLPFEMDLWGQLGRKIGRSGEELLAEVRELFDRGLIREIGPIFNPAMLGYKTTLLAAKVPMDRLEEVAGIVSEHAGVSHNYLRDNSTFNLWFTLAVAGKQECLTREIEELARRTGVTIRRFDNLAQYKISFRLSDEIPKSEVTSRGRAFGELDGSTQKRFAAVIEILQRGLPMTQKPFEAMAGAMGVDELLACGRELRELGILRRFGVTWRHRAIGFTENVLCVWQIPQEQIAAFAQKIMGIGQITHSYRRQSYPDWPWSIYTMIHGHTSEECAEIISQLTRAFPEVKYLAMRTMKEFKKQRVLYRPMVS